MPLPLRSQMVIAALALLISTPSLVDAQSSAFGKIERKDPRFDKLIPKDAKLEKLAEGFDWSEGPVWVRDGGYLLFSDIPRNSVMKWKQGEGVTLYLKPSGYTGVVDYGKEPGSNGLALDSEGRLISCEHGDRRVSRLEKQGGKRTLADSFQGKRLNSPNDLVFHSGGDLYFTDPPYGLPQNVNDARKELDFQGVYRLSPSHAPSEGPKDIYADYELTLLTKEMSRPNGIGLSPDEKTLYVANSDPAKAIWMAFEVNSDGTLGKGRVFFDATSWVGQKKGLPDGLKVDQQGNLFATGPGGVQVFAPDGTHLGSIDTGEATANCAFGDDGSTLYITADMYLCRIKTTTKGLGF